MPQKSIDERLENLTRQRAQLEARHAALMATKKTADRKRDTRRKIVVGAAVLAHADESPVFAHQLRALLDLTLTREIDRAAVADLLSLPGERSDVAA